VGILMNRFQRTATAWDVLRITPDRTVRNIQSHVLATSLHDLHAPFLRRWRIEGHTLRYRAPVRFWYLVDLSETEAAFFIAAPIGDASAYLPHRVGRLWPKATLQRTSVLALPPENTEGIELKLASHNLFSLTAKASEDTYPLSDLLGLLAELRKGDRVRIAYCIEPFDRVAWADMVQHAEQELAHGKVPKRAHIESHMAPMQWLEVVNGALYELHDVVAGVDATREEVRRKDRERNQPPQKSSEIQAATIRDDTRAKRTQAPFKVWIHLPIVPVTTPHA